MLGKRLTASGDVVGVKLISIEELVKNRTDIDVKASEVSGSRELVEGKTDVELPASGVSGSKELVANDTDVEAGVVAALVCEQGTTVVMVTSRSVVKVFLAVRGQSVTEAGHWVRVSVTVERIVEVVEESRTDVDVGKSSIIDVDSMDNIRLDVAFVGDTTTLVCEQGTIVVMVTSRSVVKVFRAVRGQSVTEAGHLVIVSVTVERIVEVVEEARTVDDDRKSSLVDVISADVAFVRDTTTLLVAA